ncbi:tyrosine-type recombinase/integrase [Candidatus Cytomitobacter primus]|uniref:Tyrosine-type recombinase/integrase n=1 Tax=Candidatus Cytomitobacter primus TaxID=2066024 RepID=A0A5C0UFQ3_9PROT|nr:tyrosine-type recombinase/integrase [Candidatus Cytomitobacter primus]
MLSKEFISNPEYEKIFKIITSFNTNVDFHDKMKEFAYNLIYIEAKQINTVMSYLYDIKLSIDFFIQYRNENISLDILKKLTRLDFRALYSERRKINLSPFSQRRLISAWRNLFKFLNYKDIFIALSIKTPKTFPKSVPKKIIEDLCKVDQTWISYRNRALWGLLYGSGMRVSEALNLNIADWVKAKDNLEINGKGKVIRKVPIFAIIKTWMTEYLERYPMKYDQKSPLFIGKQLFKRLGSQTCAHILAKWRIKHNIDQKITPHSLRHSFASHVLANDCNLKDLQQVLGHKNLDTTSIYTHIEDKKLEKSFMDIME